MGNDELRTELERLRAEVRRMGRVQRLAGAGLLAGGLVLVGLGASGASTVRAHRYELLGMDGKAVMTLEAGPNGPDVRVHGVAAAPAPLPQVPAPSPVPVPVVVAAPSPDSPPAPAPTPPVFVPGRPTLASPGLDAVDAMVRFEVRGRATSVEVICEDVGFRERAALREGVATVILPEGTCRALVHSVAPYPWVDVKPGDWLICEESPRLTCRRAR